MVRTPLSLLPISVLFFLPNYALADDLAWSQIHCTPPALLDASIRYCTDNTQAILQAQACSAQISRAWSEAAKDLAVLRDGADSQRLGMGLSQERYDRAVERIQKLIDETKTNTDLLAQYPSVMVDAPTVEAWDDSLPCYREAYDQIQQTVTDLDRKTAQGRVVLAKATELRATLKQLADNVKGQALPAAARGTEPALARVPAASRHPAVMSDITGVRKDADVNNY